jgi:hypothetical protein
MDLNEIYVLLVYHVPQPFVRNLMPTNTKLKSAQPLKNRVYIASVALAN